MIETIAPKYNQTKIRAEIWLITELTCDNGVDIVVTINYNIQSRNIINHANHSYKYISSRTDMINSPFKQ